MGAIPPDGTVTIKTVYTEAISFPENAPHAWMYRPVCRAFASTQTAQTGMIHGFQENEVRLVIRVCDAIMGSGKTESAITYINENPDKRFIYITPFLDEAERIRKSCPAADFAEPSDRIPEAGFRKVDHTHLLVREGRNIASTHSAFRQYTPEMLRDIRAKHYTLIVDEALDVLSEAGYTVTDVELLVASGYVRKRGNRYTVDSTCKEYGNGLFNGLIQSLRRREPMYVETQTQSLFYWLMPPRFLEAFADIIIMTYMFEGQEICSFLKIYKMGYQKIGVHRDDTPEGPAYRFGDYQEYIPEYVQSLKSKIHIIDSQKLNAIGRTRTSLSMTWFKRNPQSTGELKRALRSVYLRQYADVPSAQRMWSTYKERQDQLRGRGYSKSFLPFNARATNAYRQCTVLAYLVNIYLNVGHKILFAQLGAPIDENAYALSTMIQWIWRSAIRDGQDIYLYLPSSRMRKLLTDWMDDVGKEVSKVEQRV